MTPEHPNRLLVRSVAQRLGDLRGEVVFLGGAATNFLISDPAAPEIRATKDVDVIVEVGNRGEYWSLEKRLRARGFEQDPSRDAPLCRWLIQGVRVDVMPTDKKILGFANSWYAAAMAEPQEVELAEGLTIRIVTAPLFIATKIEAFGDRGEGDFIASHDIEDLIAVADGRPELVEEIRAAPLEVREYLRMAVGAWLSDPQFREALPGHLPPDGASQARVPLVLGRLESIRAISRSR